ncbi:MAG: cysteine hydrolase [Candidatus Thermoplasmatota archaeon]|nr:cysteine hydrolase [Candidatus Thermoplasmatota archaeon]
MKTRKILSEFKEIVGPDHTALVVWDVQNLLVSRIFNREEFLKNVTDLIAMARKADVPIFFTKITPLPERFESGVRLSQRRFPGGISPEQMELSIKPEQDDIILLKNTANIFIGTNFELMIRNAGIQTIIFSGIATEIGIESSARDSMNRGFYTVVVEDAVSSADKSAHERSLANMRNMLMVRKTSEIAGAWT